MPKDFKNIIYGHNNPEPAAKQSQPQLQEQGGTMRIQVRVTNSNYKILQDEAQRTATSLSAVAGIALADFCDNIQMKRAILEDEVVKPEDIIATRDKKQKL